MLQRSKITGATLPVLEMALQPGDKIVAEPGEFSWMSGNVQLNTTTQTAGAKGLFGVLGRAWVELGGEIITYDLAPGQVIQAHPGTSACSKRACSSTRSCSAA